MHTIFKLKKISGIPQIEHLILLLTQQAARYNKVEEPKSPTPTTKSKILQDLIAL